MADGTSVYRDVPKTILLWLPAAIFSGFILYECVWSLGDGTYLTKGGRRESGAFGIAWNVLGAVAGLGGLASTLRVIATVRCPVLQFTREALRIRKPLSGDWIDLPWREIGSVYHERHGTLTLTPNKLILTCEIDSGHLRPVNSLGPARIKPARKEVQVLAPLSVSLGELVAAIEHRRRNLSDDGPTLRPARPSVSPQHDHGGAREG